MMITSWQGLLLLGAPSIQRCVAFQYFVKVDMALALQTFEDIGLTSLHLVMIST